MIARVLLLFQNMTFLAKIVPLSKSYNKVTWMAHEKDSFSAWWKTRGKYIRPNVNRKKESSCIFRKRYLLFALFLRGDKIKKTILVRFICLKQQIRQNLDIITWIAENKGFYLFVDCTIKKILVKYNSLWISFIVHH